jgi:Flp pilus assembly protein protease CpaA
MTMQGILYEEPSALLFVLVTIVMGGAAAWQMGRSIAQTWRPFWMVFAYAAALNCGVRFIHYALFQGTLLSIHFYLVDYVVIVAFTIAGWRKRRAEQMASQYAFSFEAAGPFAWRRKSS